ALDPAPLLARFRAQHPAVDIRLIETTLDATVELLHSDRLDLCFAFCRPDGAGEGIAGEQLFDDELALMVAPDHPLARRRRVALESPADEPLTAPTTGASVRLS